MFIGEPGKWNVGMILSLQKGASEELNGKIINPTFNMGNILIVE